MRNITGGTYQIEEWFKIKVFNYLDIEYYSIHLKKITQKILRHLMIRSVKKMMMFKI